MALPPPIMPKRTIQTLRIQAPQRQLSGKNLLQTALRATIRLPITVVCTPRTLLLRLRRRPLRLVTMRLAIRTAAAAADTQAQQAAAAAQQQQQQDAYESAQYAQAQAQRQAQEDAIEQARAAARAQAQAAAQQQADDNAQRAAAIEQAAYEQAQAQAIAAAQAQAAEAERVAQAQANAQYEAAQQAAIQQAQAEAAAQQMLTSIDSVGDSIVSTGTGQVGLDANGNIIEYGTGEDLSFGSALPGPNVVADLSGWGNLNQADFLSEAGSGVQLEKSYDAFGNEYATADQAAQADVDMGITGNEYATGDGVIPVIGKDLIEIGASDYAPATLASGLESAVSSALDTGVDLGLVGDRVANPEFITNAAGIDDRSGLDMFADENYVNTTGDTSIYDKFTVPVTLPVATDKTTLETVLSNYSDGQYAEMAENIDKLSDETKEILNSDIITFPNKYGYEAGQVDPGFASGLGEDTDKLNFSGTSVNPKALAYNAALSAPGAVATLIASMVNLPTGMSMAATQAMGEGQTSANQVIDAAVADGSIQYNPEYQSIMSNSMNDPAFAALSDAEKNSRVINTMENQVAQGLLPLAGLGAATAALTPTVLLKPNLAGIATSSGLEALEEGVLETVVLDSAVQGNAGGLSVNPNLQDMTGEALVGALLGLGIGGGAVAYTGNNGSPVANTSVLDPSLSATSGQLAASTVQDSYKQAAESMGEAGISGVGDTMGSDIAPDKITVAEQLMNNQLDANGAIDLTGNELRDLDLSLFEMRALADQVIETKKTTNASELQARAEDSVINTGGISASLIDEINTKLDNDVANEIITTASNNPFVSNTGQSRLDMAREASNRAAGISPGATTSAIEKIIAAKPPSGVETVLGEKFYDAFGNEFDNAEDAAMRDELLDIGKPSGDTAPAVMDTTSAQQDQSGIMSGSDFISAPFDPVTQGGISKLGAASEMETDFVAPASDTAPAVMETVAKPATPVIKARDVLSQYGEDIDTMGASPVRTNRIADAQLIEEFVNSYEQGSFVNVSNISERIGSWSYTGGDPKKIAAAQTRLEKAGILGPADSNGDQELLAEVATEGLTSSAPAPGTGSLDAASAISAYRAGDGTGIPKAIMTERYVAHPSEGTVTQSAVDLVNKGLGNVSQQELLDVAEENGIVAGPGTSFLPGQVFTELSDRAGDSNLEVITEKAAEQAAAEQAAAELAAKPVYSDNVQKVLDKAQNDTGSVTQKDVDTLKDAGLLSSEDGLANGVAISKIKGLLENETVVTPDASGGATVEFSDGSTSTTVNQAATNTEKETEVELEKETEVELEKEVEKEVEKETEVELEAQTEVESDPYEEEDEEDVLVEIPEEDEADEVDTVDEEVPDILVPVITSTDDDGNTINECPEGFELMEDDDGPVCQKITKVVSSRQRQGISVGRDKDSGLAGNRGRISPGQRRKIKTSSTYERVAPTTTSA